MRERLYKNSCGQNVYDGVNHCKFNENGQSISKKAKIFGKMSHCSCVIAKPDNSSVISPKHWIHLRFPVVANGKIKKGELGFFLPKNGPKIGPNRPKMIAKPHNFSVISPKHWIHLRFPVVANGKKKRRKRTN